MLIARLSGVFDVQSDEETDRLIAKTCNEGGYKQVLIDFRNVDIAATPFESYQSGASLGERGFTRSIKIAIIDRLEFKKANYLYGLVARNRGYQLQHFYGEEDAMTWLFED